MMKKQFLNLGNASSKAEQKEVNGGARPFVFLCEVTCPTYCECAAPPYNDYCVYSNGEYCAAL